MDTKKEARSIVDSYMDIFVSELGINPRHAPVARRIAKKCALNGCDKILDTFNEKTTFTTEEYKKIDSWREVKEEIEKQKP